LIDKGYGIKLSHVLYVLLDKRRQSKYACYIGYVGKQVIDQGN